MMMFDPDSVLVTGENPHGGSFVYEILEADVDTTHACYLVNLWFEIIHEGLRMTAEKSIVRMVTLEEKETSGLVAGLIQKDVDEVIHETYRCAFGSSALEGLDNGEDD